MGIFRKVEKFTSQFFILKSFACKEFPLAYYSSQSVRLLGHFILSTKPRRSLFINYTTNYYTKRQGMKFKSRHTLTSNQNACTHKNKIILKLLQTKSKIYPGHYIRTTRKIITKKFKNSTFYR